MAVLLAHLKVPLSWMEIVKRTVRDGFYDDDCLGLAAQLAYYFFFALFPALLVLLAFASYFPLERLIDDMFAMLGGFVPPEALTIITDQIKKISEGQKGSLLTFGMLTALWTSSAAMTSVIDTLNSAYDIEEGRPWWRVRLTAIGLTIGVALFIIVSFGLVLVGPRLAEYIADYAYLGPAFEWTWKVLQWPLVFVLASSGVCLIYYFAPDAEQDWVWLTPGSVLATTLWLIASLGFKYYVANMGNYTETYGAIGGVMVLMLWFYISGLVILLGAEMNAVIEHASPYGKEPGEKVPGQKRKIGAAAMRAWVASRRREHDKPPSAGEIEEVTGPAPASTQPGGPAPAPARPPLALPSPASARASSWMLGAGIVAAQVWLALKALRNKKIGA